MILIDFDLSKADFFRFFLHGYHLDQSFYSFTLRGGQVECFQVTSQVKPIERFFKSSQVKSMVSGKFSKSVKSDLT
jgi:hypothetical protein